MWGALQDLRKLREAVVYGYGLYEFARSIQVLSNQIPRADAIGWNLAADPSPGGSGPLLNRHVHVRDLATPRDRAVTTPNNDTLYTSAVLELSQGPVEVTVPDSSGRYLSVALMDRFHDQVAYLGTRATQGRGGTFWLVGPGQDVAVPDHAERLSLPSHDLWLLARVFVAGGDDLEAARAVQSQVSVRPVDEARRGRPFATRATSVEDARNFLDVVNELLARSPLEGHAARARAFERLGIRPGARNAYGALPFWKRQLWSRVLGRLEDTIAKRIAERQGRQAGWMTPPPILGACGRDDETRAAVALIGFGALTIEEAMYFRAMTDASGAPLDGHGRYRMRIPPDVPVDAFWSLSMYAPDERNRLFFYDNELDRYAINSASDALRAQADGDIVLAMQRERPADPSLVWMPTPDGPFEALFRAYLPKPSLRTGAWRVPALARLDGGPS
jgi:hypothetical protein